MKKQHVDVASIVLRLLCKCGAAVSVVPSAMKQTVFQCPNCGEVWPGAVDDSHLPRSPVQRLAQALRDLQIEDAKTGSPSGYRVQFEIDMP